MITNSVRVNVFASVTAPDPTIVDYWVDLHAHPLGNVIKFYDPNIGKWVKLTDASSGYAVAPYIGSNGNWFVENIDTGIPATGPMPYIGSNGNWFIYDTSLKTFVDTGIRGQGWSAYELAVQNGFQGTEAEWLASLSEASENAAAIAIAAAQNANDAADRVDQSIEDAQEATTNAITATEAAETATEAATLASYAANTAAQGANTAANRANTIAQNPPQIRDNYWWFYDEDSSDYVNSGLPAKGDSGFAPRVSETTNNWEVYDIETDTWVDTGVDASSGYELTKAKVEEVLTGEITSHTHDTMYFPLDRGEALEDFVEEQLVEENAYFFVIDEGNPNPEIDEMGGNDSVPIALQNKFKRVAFKDTEYGAFKRDLHPDDSRVWANDEDTEVSLSGDDGEFFVEIPEYYIWKKLDTPRTEGFNTYKYFIALTKLTAKFTKVDSALIGMSIPKLKVLDPTNMNKYVYVHTPDIMSPNQIVNGGVQYINPLQVLAFANNRGPNWGAWSRQNVDTMFYMYCMIYGLKRFGNDTNSLINGTTQTYNNINTVPSISCLTLEHGNNSIKVADTNRNVNDGNVYSFLGIEYPTGSVYMVNQGAFTTKSGVSTGNYFNAPIVQWKGNYNPQNYDTYISTFSAKASITDWTNNAKEFLTNNNLEGDVYYRTQSIVSVPTQFPVEQLDGTLFLDFDNQGRNSIGSYTTYYGVRVAGGTTTTGNFAYYMGYPITPSNQRSFYDVNFTAPSNAASQTTRLQYFGSYYDASNYLSETDGEQYMKTIPDRFSHPYDCILFNNRSDVDNKFTVYKNGGNVDRILSNFKRCLCTTDGNGKAYITYLNATNSLLFEDGGTAKLDGTQGDVMVHIPGFWYRWVYSGSYITNDSHSRLDISDVYIDDTWNYQPESLIGAFASTYNAAGIVSRQGGSTGSSSEIPSKQNQNSTGYTTKGIGFRPLDFSQFGFLALFHIFEYNSMTSGHQDYSAAGWGTNDGNPTNRPVDGYSAGLTAQYGNRNVEYTETDNPHAKSFYGIENCFSGQFIINGYSVSTSSTGGSFAHVLPDGSITNAQYTIANLGVNRGTLQPEYGYGTSNNGKFILWGRKVGDSVLVRNDNYNLGKQDCYMPGVTSSNFQVATRSAIVEDPNVLSTVTMYNSASRFLHRLSFYGEISPISSMVYKSFFEDPGYIALLDKMVSKIPLTFKDIPNGFTSDNIIIGDDGLVYSDQTGYRDLVNNNITQYLGSVSSQIHNMPYYREASTFNSNYANTFYIGTDANDAKNNCFKSVVHGYYTSDNGFLQLSTASNWLWFRGYNNLTNPNLNFAFSFPTSGFAGIAGGGTISTDIKTQTFKILDDVEINGKLWSRVPVYIPIAGNSSGVLNSNNFAYLTYSKAEEIAMALGKRIPTQEELTSIGIWSGVTADPRGTGVEDTVNNIIGVWFGTDADLKSDSVNSIFIPYGGMFTDNTQNYYQTNYCIYYYSNPNVLQIQIGDATIWSRVAADSESYAAQLLLVKDVE